MAKTTTIKLYRYSELKGSNQDAAKHHVGDHWWEQLHEDERDVARSHLAELGLPMQNNEYEPNPNIEMAIDTSCCQGSGMSITGRFDMSEVDECEPLVDIYTDYPQFRPEDLTVIITHNTHHYVHEYTMDVEVEFHGDTVTWELEQIEPGELEPFGPEQDTLVDQPVIEMAERVREVLIRFCKEAHGKALECSLSDSDGYINEWMDNMGYWFDEDGQIIERSED